MNPDRRRWFFGLTGALVVVAVAVAVWLAPWVPVLLFALVIESFLLCWALPDGPARNIALAAGVALVITGGIDQSSRRWADYAKYRADYPREYIAGAYGAARAAPASFRVAAVNVDTGKRIYEVTYTLDTHGHRLTEGGGPGADTYLFFGDSYTYGEGVADGETYPARFSEAAGRRFTVVNLGFHGYGPNHILRLLEEGAADQVVTGKVRRVYYSLIGDHANRVVGARRYMLRGPQYVLDAGGRPVFAGRFIDHLPGRLADLAELAGGLPERLRNLIWLARYPPAMRAELVAAILARSQALITEKYGAELVVLVWDGTAAANLVPAINRRGIRTIDVSSLIGDPGSPELQVLPEVDNHPNAEADRRLGHALAAREGVAE
jgi:hypothetical protein